MSSPQLQALLKEVLGQVPPPTGGADYTQSYLRNQQIQKLLYLAIIAAAEERWPGIQGTLERLHEREQQFLRLAGPVA